MINILLQRIDSFLNSLFKVSPNKEESAMKKLVLVIAMAACLVGVTGQASAATTDTIEVTVSLGEVISVTLNLDAWNIGAIAIDFVSSAFPVVATNAGNVNIDLNINGETGAGGWTLAGAVGEDAFMVTVTPAVITPFAMTTGGGTKMFDALPHTTSNTTSFNLTYNAPNGDTVGPADQGFTITVTASMTP